MFVGRCGEMGIILNLLADDDISGHLGVTANDVAHLVLDAIS